MFPGINIGVEETVVGVFADERNIDAPKAYANERWKHGTVRTRVGTVSVFLGFLPVVAGMFLVAEAFLSPPATSSINDEPSATIEQVVEEPTGGPLRLPNGQWKAMTNEFPWAENFEQIAKGLRHEFPRVVTVFKLPMTDDRRVGIRISPNEYVEMFVANPGAITMQVRVDKKSYWVMSRETFLAKSIYGVDTSTPSHSIYDEEFKWARQAFQPEIDTTRYLLQTSF